MSEDPWTRQIDRLIGFIIASFIFGLYIIFSTSKSSTLKGSISSKTPPNDILVVETPQFNPNMEGTTGHLFKGELVRNYTLPRMFHSLTQEELNQKLHKRPNFRSRMLTNNTSGEFCLNWAVVTTINPPTPATEKQANLPGWCMVVVGDKKGPHSYPLNQPKSEVIFLDVKKQEDLITDFPFIKNLPWNHFGRKNLGYLYAIAKGAQNIYDFDDDNLLTARHLHLPGSKEYISSYQNNSHIVINNQLHFQEPVCYNESVLNPYPLFHPTNPQAWPRGYPLEKIKSTLYNRNPFPIKTNSFDNHNIGVVQYLANNDPDVDAIYRLTQPLPFDFSSKSSPQLVLPYNCADKRKRLVFAPYNGQATLHLYSALWSLLLPVTIHGRVSDIWRGYAAQRIFSDINIRLSFHAAIVVQYRNSHNYLADFDSEEPLYKQSQTLVDELMDWEFNQQTLPGRIEALWISLYEHAYIGLEDVKLMQSWLFALIQIGYKFPVIPHA